MDDCIHEYMTFSVLANDYTDGASEHEEHEVTVNDENNEAHSLGDVDSDKNEHNHSTRTRGSLCETLRFKKTKNQNYQVFMVT